MPSWRASVSYFRKTGGEKRNRFGRVFEFISAVFGQGCDFDVRTVHNGSRASQPRARGTTRANRNPALDGKELSEAPAFRTSVGCSLVPFTCALASCSVCAQNESFIIFSVFGPKRPQNGRYHHPTSRTGARPRPSEALPCPGSRMGAPHAHNSNPTFTPMS